ncbi:MAG: MinD/ParA family protein [Thermaerobacter sp.]|jgi:flagellar biosynthesis protein FlhG|nr:MinD/ParA family protein [Thermaerobacter sp.]MDA8146716.1 MinD/ParA family protein [Thermaerobacter sp.]
MADQAEPLRLLAEKAHGRSAARIVAVTSGKGGVGKTNFTLSLGVALRRLGREVLVFDADLGLGNVDVILGESPPFHLGHVVRGEKTLEEVVYRGPEGLGIVAGGGGLAELLDPPPGAQEAFLSGLERLERQTDMILVDTGAGLSRQVLSFALAADEVLLVTTPEPTALADAYVTLKHLLRRRPDLRLRVVVNRAADAGAAGAAMERLAGASRRFLGREVEGMGYVLEDPAVGRAVARQQPFLLAYPHSPASRCTQNLAALLVREAAVAQKAGGGFLRRLWQRAGY